VIRVFIVAASPLIRAGLQSMLADSRFDIVGSAADLESLSGQFVDVEPDVVLVEAATYAQEELLNALEVAELAQEYPVILLSQQPKTAWLSKALRAGVRAVLPVTSLRNNSVPHSKPLRRGWWSFTPRNWIRSFCHCRPVCASRRVA